MEWGPSVDKISTGCVLLRNGDEIFDADCDYRDDAGCMHPRIGIDGGEPAAGADGCGECESAVVERGGGWVGVDGGAE